MADVRDNRGFANTIRRTASIVVAAGLLTAATQVTLLSHESVLYD